MNRGILVGLLLSVAVAVPSTKAEIVTPDLVRATLLRVGLVTSALLGTPFEVGGGAIFSWAAQASLVPETGSTVTYTSNSVHGYTDVHGTVREASANMVPPWGTEVVTNELSQNGTPSEDITGAEWTKDAIGNGTTPAQVSGNTYTFVTGGTGSGDRSRLQPASNPAFSAGDYVVLSFDAYASEAVDLTVFTDTGDIQTVSITTENQRYFIATPSHGGTGDLNFELRGSVAGNVSVDITLDRIMPEIKTGNPNKNPGPYVSVGVLSSPYHGLGVDGKKAFSTHNGNTVSGNVVTEATGPAITDSNSKFANFPFREADDNYSQADSAQNSITGDIDVRVRAALSDWSNNTQGLINKLTGSTNQSWRFYVGASGQLTFQASPDGTEGNSVYANSTVNLDFANGEIGWVRVVRDDSEQEVAFYYSRDPALNSENVSNWTQLGSVVAQAFSGINDSTSDVRIGNADANADSLALNGGRIYRAQVYDTIDGTSANIDFDPNDTTGWTENGNAYIYTPPEPGFASYEAYGNDLTYSEDHTNAAWSVSSATIDSAVETVNGISMDRINVTAAAAAHFLYRTSAETTSVDTDVAYEVYLKDDGARYVQVRIFFDTNDWAAVVYDLESMTKGETATGSGTTSLTSSDIEVLPDGQIRAIVVAQDSADTTYQCAVDVLSTATPTRNSGVGSEDWTPSGGEDVLIGGSMAQEASSSSPYIKTEGSAVATVAEVYTVAAPVAGLPASVSVVTTITDATSVSNALWNLSDGTPNDRWEVFFNGSYTPTAYYQTSDAGNQETNAAFSTGALTRGTAYTIGYSNAEDDGAWYENGTAAGTDSTVDAVGSDWTIMHFGSNYTGAQQLNGQFRNIKVWNKRLTDAQQAAEAE